MINVRSEDYTKLTDDEEIKLDTADRAAESGDRRLFHHEIFDDIREKIKYLKII